MTTKPLGRCSAADSTRGVAAVDEAEVEPVETTAESGAAVVDGVK